MRARTCIAALLLGVAVLLSVHCSDEEARLRSDYPVVSGDQQLSADWSLTLPRAFNRRIEDKALVLWRPGVTVWLTLWGNDRGLSPKQRLDSLRATTESDAFEVSIRSGSLPMRYTYRLDEQRDEGTVHALYGFVLKPDRDIQAAIYVDDRADLEIARSILDSIR